MARCKGCVHDNVCNRDVGHGYSVCPHYFSTDVAPKSEEGAECPTCYGTGRIGTTNWLTQNMTKKQIAEEKAQAIAEYEQYIKAEVAREIFVEIEEIIRDRKLKELKRQGDNKMISPFTYSLGALEIIEFQFAELKKKYTGGE